MVTNDSQISGTYNKEVYLSLILHVHCGLAAHLLHSKAQVDGTTLIWNISGLLAEGKVKVKDHVMALRLLCESGCATSLARANCMALGVGMYNSPTGRAEDVEINSAT